MILSYVFSGRPCNHQTVNWIKLHWEKTFKEIDQRSELSKYLAKNNYCGLYEITMLIFYRLYTYNVVTITWARFDDLNINLSEQETNFRMLFRIILIVPKVAISLKINYWSRLLTFCYHCRYNCKIVSLRSSLTPNVPYTFRISFVRKTPVQYNSWKNTIVS